MLDNVQLMYWWNVIFGKFGNVQKVVAKGRNQLFYAIEIISRQSSKIQSYKFICSNNSIHVNYPNSHYNSDQVLPKKASVFQHKSLDYSIYSLGQDAYLFFNFEDVLYPNLKLLHKYPGIPSLFRL
jgi:hypothetical protein